MIGFFIVYIIPVAFYFKATKNNKKVEIKVDKDEQFKKRDAL